MNLIISRNSCTTADSPALWVGWSPCLAFSCLLYFFQADKPMTEITPDATGIVAREGRCSLTVWSTAARAITPQATNYSQQTTHTFQLTGESIGKWLFVLVLFLIITASGNMWTKWSKISPQKTFHLTHFHFRCIFIALRVSWHIIFSQYHLWIFLPVAVGFPGISRAFVLPYAISAGLRVMSVSSEVF